MELSAQNISKKYNENKILDNINFSVKTGESLSITGQSGRGKSTLLSIAGLLLDPDEGSLTLDGKELLTLTPKEKAALRNKTFGFLFQDIQLIGSLTILDNVLIPALLGKEKNMENRARELLVQFGLQDRLYHYPHQLSIGQKRRASIARALLLSPPFIFADEPTNDLDEENIEIVTRTLLGLAQENKGVIIVTHDMDLANRTTKNLPLN